MVLIGFLTELILAIPVLGGSIVVGSAYSALVFGFIIHLLVFIMAAIKGRGKVAPVFGMITCALAWIPFLGWIMHTISAVIYLVAIVKKH